MAYSENEIEAANKRATSRLMSTPSIKEAKYIRRTNKLVVDLNTGMTLMFSPNDAQGFEQAKPDQLAKIEISPSGQGLHFPSIDADLYLPGLLEGMLGSRKWMATQLGKKGGRATSRAKTSASRENGKLGGRPKKPGTTANIY